jgi:hypothetical protein
VKDVRIDYSALCSVVVGLSKYVAHKDKTCILNHLLRSTQKCASLRVGLELEYDLEDNRSLHRVRVFSQNFATLDKRQIGVEFCLENFLVMGTVRLSRLMMSITLVCSTVTLPPTTAEPIDSLGHSMD